MEQDISTPHPKPVNLGHLGAPALVLNADFRPLSYYPLSLMSWQDALKACFLDRVHVVSEYEDYQVCSPSTCINLPSVVALKEYVPPKERPAFTRFNLFLRDNFTCQYCNDKLPAHDLTFDHLIPRCKGGGTNWENIVTACRPCNTAKGHKLPSECGMHPMTKPVQPTFHQLQHNGRAFPPNFLHEDWHDFLYWDTELDE